MAVKKYYAVKRGKATGIFQTWDECRNAVEGYSGAQYKGFSTLKEAKEYLGDVCSGQTVTEREEIFSGGHVHVRGKSSFDQAGSEGAGSSYPKTVRQEEQKSRESGTGETPNDGELLAYVDGSYDDHIKKYAFGCVFLLSDGRIFTEYGNGDNEQSLQHRNVTGEMLGAMYAVKFAMLNGFRSVEIRYDYQGIEKWVTGEWRSKTELTRKYAVSMREWGKSVSIRFMKVTAHTNVRYNELADKMAKTGLTLGNGVPKVRKIEDMEEYHGENESK